MVFLRKAGARRRVEAACEAEGLRILGWRTVPIDDRALGKRARTSRPEIAQLVIQRPLGADSEEAERRAFRARERLAGDPGTYVC
jgi:glutamate synthase domain-containing protein 1